MKKGLLLIAALLTANITMIAQPLTMSHKAGQEATKVQRLSRFGDENANANVSNTNNMVREMSFYDLDFTTYDWQSNSGPLTRSIVWPDGKINFAYTIASNSQYNDRGTGIGTYDSNTGETTPLGGRIENEETGFGTIARYLDNSIVVAAHTSNQCGIYIIEDKDNMTPNSVGATCYLENTYEPTWPNVMTSGANHEIIHVIATAYSATIEGVKTPLLYFRSQDGGQTWDKENVILPYLNGDYTIALSSNDAYWLETGDNNRLTLIVNTSWIDGMAIYSEDNGDTWQMTKFYDWPNEFAVYQEEDSVWTFYPRYVSALWDEQNQLHIAYEWNATGSLSALADQTYYAGLGGIGYWNEALPYNINNDATPGTQNPQGQPFVLDTAYLFNDMYASMWYWSDATHDIWPEFIGYLTPLDDDGNPESLETFESFNIDLNGELANHGRYNCGIASFPVLVKEKNTGYMVSIWSSMDENNKDGNENYYFKIFARGSADNGLTWSDMKQLTTDFSFIYAECAYNQAVALNGQLIIATQTDGEAGSYVQEDDADYSDNMYQVLVFDLEELFENYDDGVSEVETTTVLNIFPNPANETINVNINKAAEIAIYNIMGQAVKSVNGHAGINTVNVNDLSSGVYFMSIGEKTTKFVVK